LSALGRVDAYVSRAMISRRESLRAETNSTAMFAIPFRLTMRRAARRPVETFTEKPCKHNESLVRLYCLTNFCTARLSCAITPRRNR